MKTESEWKGAAGTPSPPPGRGPSRLRLIVAFVVIAALAVVIYGIVDARARNQAKANALVRQAYQLHQGLVAYAQAHDGEFPNSNADGSELKSSNEAFRQFFVAHLVDDENVFYVEGSPWSWKKPDGDKGTALDGRLNALGRGENHWGYIRGLNMTRDNPDLPILVDGFLLSKPGAPASAGGGDRPKQGIIVRIGGNAKIYELDSSGKVKERVNGKDVDVLSPEFGTKPENILKPE